MKKLLSVVLVVAMLATACFTMTAISVSADSDFLGYTAASNDAAGASVAMDNGQLNITVTKPWEGESTDKCYGASLIPAAAETYTITDKAFVWLSVTSEVPFRVTVQDASQSDGVKWIGFGSEFFNMFTVDGKPLEKAPEGNFLPAGSYTVSCYLSGYYEWNVKGATTAAINGVYVEGKEAGKISINCLKLTMGADKETYAGPAAPTIGGSGSGTTATTAKAGTTTAKAGTTTASNAKTGWEDNIALYAIVALGAAAVVTVTVVSGKKAKSK